MPPRSLPAANAMLSILAVFVPSFLMVGVPKALFVPLSLAVGLAMMASYLLSNTLVPVLSVWLLREGGQHADSHSRTVLGHWQERYAALLHWIGEGPKRQGLLLALYALLSLGTLLLVGRQLGLDLFPEAASGMLQLRLRAPTGTRVERTEQMAIEALRVVREQAGPDGVELTLGYVGTQPASYPVNTIHLWTNGPQEAVLQIKLRREADIDLPALKERLRQVLPQRIPGATISLEAGDLVSQIMNFGAPTPIEVAMSGPNLAANRAFAEKILVEMRQIPVLRDLQFGQPLDYPTVNIDIDRERAGQLGLTVAEVGRSLVAATSSSRFTQPTYWRDPASGTAYQVQVEIPQHRMRSIEDLLTLPVGGGGSRQDPQRATLVGDLARLSYGTMPGEVDRYNQQRMITILGNLAGSDLGSAVAQVEQAIARVGSPPRGVSVAVRGQAPALDQTLTGLSSGLLLSIVAIVLLLAAYFQSARLPLVVLGVLPAVLAGVAVSLRLSGTTLNLQSFMGTIMAIGVSTANAILLVSFAEQARQEGLSSLEAALRSGISRLRPICMTTLAMIAGMVPMALAIGEGSEQTAPLGRAVIGGLAGSIIAVLLVLPFLYAIGLRRAKVGSPSLFHGDPPTSRGIQ